MRRGDGGARRTDLQAARPEVSNYRWHRRRLRFTLLGAWLGVFLCWLGSSFFLSTSDRADDGPLPGVMVVVWVVASLALVFIMPVYFVWHWSRTRVDSLEVRPEAEQPDRFPPDRTVAGEGPIIYAAAVLSFAVTAGGLPWLYLGDGGASPIARAVLVDAAVVAVLAFAVPRIYRQGLYEVPEGLIVRSAIETWVCPWAKVRGFRLECDRFQAVIFPEMDDERPVPSIGLATRTRRGRARARHNLRVLTRWTDDKGLPESGIRSAWLHVDGILPPPPRARQ